MAVISGADYLLISQDVSDARDVALLAKDDLFEAVYKVVLLQVINPEVDLLNIYWETYLSNTQIQQPSTSLLSAVSALNNHVIRRANVDDVDTYLWNYVWPQKVTATWQDLSTGAGFAISDMYVDLLP